ncbi:conserved oligomeric Golgi complex subunit 8 [Nasonia vitripennis]|uniref:Conserved oligomeric Golgi complex subunit 8 n=1 Tax=Nasonia vitripennis TaxID=7425 RepID=A0A7M7G642_NASVI|nr:conserved oligomeric Golgi complex subunit 8 [Nasonia vitripennis]
MDIETEKIIDLLFPEGIPESWKDNPDFYQYLSKVGGYDVDGLLKEPDHLADEKNAVQQSTQELVFSNYKIFLRSAEDSREIFREFNQTEDRLDGLLEKIPQFMNKCKSFCNTSKDINTHKRLNSLILSKTTELLEILELPQLMESCLRSNQYSEALELSQYVRHLGAKHGDIPIIASIVNEIENSWSIMVNQVVNSLKEDLPLPRCLQLIGLLRSMDAFTESELRIKFIQARDSWLQALLDSIPAEDPNIHLTKTIELSRIHLFNIITQYKAMFNDDDHLAFGRDSIINDSAIFYQWLEEKVSQFLKTLEQDLPHATSIDSILGQCTYFGLSFGRVGADFTGRMSDIFIKVISNKFESNVSKTTKKFEKDIDNFTLIHKSHKSDTKIETVMNSENPPEQLVEYYPLAEYCNGLIAAFNELRLNTPVALAQSFTNLLQNSLHTVAKTMFSYYKKRQKNFTPADRENMVRFTECFSEQLIPYIQYCIHALFPPNQVATHLGTSVSQLQKEEISYLNQKSIVEPLESLLPIKNIPMDIYMPDISPKDTINADSNIEIEPSQHELIKEAAADVQPIEEMITSTSQHELIKGDPTHVTTGELIANTSQHELMKEAATDVPIAESISSTSQHELIKEAATHLLTEDSNSSTITHSKDILEAVQDLESSTIKETLTADHDAIEVGSKVNNS